MDDKWALSVTELNEYVRRKLAGDPVLRAVARARRDLRLQALYERPLLLRLKR